MFVRRVFSFPTRMIQSLGQQSLGWIWICFINEMNQKHAVPNVRTESERCRDRDKCLRIYDTENPQKRKIAVQKWHNGQVSTK